MPNKKGSDFFRQTQGLESEVVSDQVYLRVAYNLVYVRDPVTAAALPGPMIESALRRHLALSEKERAEKQPPRAWRLLKHQQDPPEARPKPPVDAPPPK